MGFENKVVGTIAKVGDVIDGMGTIYFVSNSSIKVRDYNGALKTLVFQEDLPPSQGGDDYIFEPWSDPVHLGNWVFQTPFDFIDLEVSYKGVNLFVGNGNDFLTTSNNVFQIVHSKIILGNEYSKIKVKYRRTV